MTVAEQLIERGKQEGKREGILEGKLKARGNHGCKILFDIFNPPSHIIITDRWD